MTYVKIDAYKGLILIFKKKKLIFTGESELVIGKREHCSHDNSGERVYFIYFGCYTCCCWDNRPAWPHSSSEAHRDFEGGGGKKRKKRNPLLVEDRVRIYRGIQIKQVRGLLAVESLLGKKTIALYRLHTWRTLGDNGTPARTWRQWKSIRSREFIFAKYRTWLSSRGFQYIFWRSSPFRVYKNCRALERWRSRMPNKSLNVLKLSPLL